jgi:BASS family bile acid:Na+ symporter
MSDLVSTVLLPIALGIIMLGLGLTLTIDDFKRVLVYPRAVLVGLFCQMIVLPLVCYSICVGLSLPPILAVGMMLLAASPGGATANLFSHLSNGDVALNITLTAVNSVLSVFTLPILVSISMVQFMGEEKAIPFQFGKAIQVFAIILVPVGIGMLIRAKKQAFAEGLNKPVRLASVVFLILIIVAAILKERANIGVYFAQVGTAALIFNLASMMTGYGVPLLFKIPQKQSIAIGMEIGIHNGTLAIAIATTVLESAPMSIPAAIYSLIMFFTAGIFGLIVSGKLGALLFSKSIPNPSESKQSTPD